MAGNHDQGGSGYDIQGRIYGQDGTAQGSSFVVNSQDSGDQIRPSIAALTDSGFVATWSSFPLDGGVAGIHGQRFDADGLPIGEEFQANTYIPGTHDRSSVAPSADGGFIVIWNSDGQDGSSQGVYGQRFSPLLASVTEDTPITLARSALVSGLMDIDGDLLTVAGIMAGHGTVVDNGDGAFTYTPAANYNGADSLAYTVSDGQGGTVNATLNLAVIAENDVPLAVADSVTTAEDTVKVFDVAVVAALAANDTDVDGDTLTVTGLVAGPTAHGALVNNNGTYTYTPALNYNGADSFSYTVSDGHGGTALGTVNLTVTPVNDAPEGAWSAPPETLAFGDLRTLVATTAIARSFTSADFNGDGNLDFATVVPNGIEVHLNDGAGGFGTSNTFPCADVGQISSADVNNDGFLDLLNPTGAPTATGAGGLSVLFGDGLGGFAAPVSYSFSSVSVNVFAADFDNDGWTDVAVSNGNWRGFDTAIPGHSVSILRNTGGGNFQVIASYSTPSGYYVSGGDMNGDGNIDLVVSAQSDSVTTMLGDGTGHFPVSLTMPVPYGMRFAVGDVTGDGLLDVVTSNIAINAGEVTGNTNFVFVRNELNTVSVYAGKGDGTYLAPQEYAAGGRHPYWVSLADMNGDGRLDVLTSNSFSNTVSVLLGQADGTLASATTYPTFGLPAYVAGTDLTGDGKADLVVAALDGGFPYGLLPNTSAGLQVVEDTSFTVSRADLLTGFLDPNGDPLGIGAVTSTHGSVTDNGDGTFTVTPSADYSGLLSLSYSVVDGQGGIVAATANLIEYFAGWKFSNFLAGDAGNNILSGGTGTDTVSYAGAAAAVTVDLSLSTAQDTVSAGVDTLVSIESLIGSNFNDTLQGNALSNRLDGGPGADILVGGDGSDTYIVDNAGDLVVESNGSAAGGTDTVLSLLASYTLRSNVENGRIISSGAATLIGNTLGNGLTGGIGNNILTGGLGVDSLTGGLGADRFDFNLVTESGITTTTRDIINDFSRAQADKIDLYSIDADAAAAGNQDFSIIMNSATSFSQTTSFTASGQLYFDTTAHVLYGNTDSDPEPEFSIKILGESSLGPVDLSGKRREVGMMDPVTLGSLQHQNKRAHHAEDDAIR